MEKRDKFYWKTWSRYWNQEAYEASRARTLVPIFAVEVRAFERKVILRKRAEQLRQAWGRAA